VNDDGTGLRKLLPEPVLFLYAVSPDGNAVAVWTASGANGDVEVDGYDGRAKTLICKGCGTAGEENRGVTPPLLSWSPDRKFLYVHSTGTRQSYAVPLPPGQLVPPLPPGGLARLSDAANLPGAKTFPEVRASGGANPSVYAYPRVTTHRNIYRIPVP
jgi:sugar lactone lactonase YvrE